MITGRKPKPTELRRLEGNPSGRPFNELEPKPRPLRPVCPDWMTEDAKSKWDELIPKLERTGVLTEIDGDALAQYCTAFANWKQYEQLAARLPPVMKVGKSGYMQQAPMVAATMKASTLVARLAERLGLDPSSRSRIVVTGGTEDDAEEFLFGQKKG